MGSTTLRLVLSALAAGSMGCAVATHPRDAPALPPTGPCAASATIVHWFEEGRHRAEVFGNSTYLSERKNFYVYLDRLEVGKSHVCWEFVSLSSERVGEIQWVHVKDFDQAIFKSSPEFDPNARRTERLLYVKQPQLGSVDYPRGSGGRVHGARVAYKVWIKIKSEGQPFEADPDGIFIKPGGYR